MTPRLQFIREEFDALPDPYLLLATAKQHLADHSPMTDGDCQAWDICHRLQNEVEDDPWPPDWPSKDAWDGADKVMGIVMLLVCALSLYGFYVLAIYAWMLLKGWAR